MKSKQDQGAGGVSGDGATGKTESDQANMESNLKTEESAETTIQNGQQTKEGTMNDQEETTWTEPSVNLAQIVQNHLAFLKTVHNIPNLHKPDYIRNAIRRYEYMWLQIASKYDKMELEPPLDVHWIWHIHMLAPRQYAIDCQNVSGTVVNHKFRIMREDVNSARATTIEIWKRWFNDEPYDIDFNAPLPKTAHVPTVMRYDILSAAARQRSFYYHVSLPHYSDAKFLETAANRYVKFLKLKRDHPEAFIVPMYDVDLMWHTHQLHPHSYARDMQALLGYLLRHDDKDTDRSRHSRLAVADASTKILWQDTYSESFHLPGTMYRGEPPLGKLHKGEFREFLIGRPMTCGFEIRAITLIGGKQGYTVDCRLTEMSRGNQGDPIRFPSVKGLPHVWVCEKMDDAVNPIQLKTKVETLLCFQFTRRDGIRSFVSKSLCKISIQADKYIRDLSLRPSVQPVVMEATDDETGYQLKISGNLLNIEPGEETLEIDFGSFTHQKMPETMESLWGPINIGRLPQGVQCPCRMATHTVYVRMQPVFTVRIIHSLELRMSVVQVLYKGKMMAISQLVGNDQLPRSSQVGLKRESVTYNEEIGERAMLIKNADGDWAIIKGEWVGFKKAKHLNDDIMCEPGDPGYFTAKITDLNTMTKSSINILKTPQNSSTLSKNRALSFQLFSGNEGVKVHTGDGYIKMGKYCKNIPELIASIFSIGVLSLMCEPRPQIFLNQGLPAYPKNPAQVPGLKTFDNLLIYNCGYLERMYSNSWIYWYHVCKTYKHKDAPALPFILNTGEDFSKREEDEKEEEENESEYIETGPSYQQELASMVHAGRPKRSKSVLGDKVFCPWDPEGVDNHGAEVAIASSANGGEFYSYAVEAALCGACSTNVFPNYCGGGKGGFSSDSGVGSGSASDVA